MIITNLENMEEWYDGKVIVCLLFEEENETISSKSITINQYLNYKDIIVF